LKTPEMKKKFEIFNKELFISKINILEASCTYCISAQIKINGPFGLPNCENLG
jgi:hypothetical protein